MHSGGGEVELRSFCLQSKHFSDRATSPGSFLFCVMPYTFKLGTQMNEMWSCRQGHSLDWEDFVGSQTGVRARSIQSVSVETEQQQRSSSGPAGEDVNREPLRGESYR